MNGKSTCNDRSVLSRIRNCLVYAINANYLLPKAIVFVVDIDLVKVVNFSGYGISVLLGKLMEWLGNEIIKILAAYKDKLPKKAIREGYPQVLWIEPPLNKNFGKEDNFKRKKFSAAIDKICKLFQNMTVLQLRKIWDYEDSNLFLAEAHRFTAEGYNLYFQAVDAVLKLWDNYLCQKILKKALKTEVKTQELVSDAGDGFEAKKNENKNKNNAWHKCHYANDKFHWQNRDHQYFRQHKFSGRRLPTPPLHEK